MSSREANIVLEASSAWEIERARRLYTTSQETEASIGERLGKSRSWVWGMAQAGKWKRPSQRAVVAPTRPATLIPFLPKPTSKPKILDPKLLKKKFKYERSHGRLIDKETDKEAGFTTAGGYRQIYYNGWNYPRAHIIWALENGGKLPRGQLGRVDGRSMNDRIQNLADIVSTDREDFYRQLHILRTKGNIPKQSITTREIPKGTMGGAFNQNRKDFWIKLDVQLKDAAYNLTLDKEFMAMMDKAGIHYQKKLDPKTQIPGGMGGCEPDGGVWVDEKGIPIAAFEAKRQGAADTPEGNMIEVWYKNEYLLRLISPKISYVTFMMGKGASIDGRARSILNIAVLNEDEQPEFNQVRPNNNSIFMHETGFSDAYIMDKMKQVLLDNTASKIAENNAVKISRQPEYYMGPSVQKQLTGTELTSQQHDRMKDIALELENDPDIKAAGLKLHRRTTAGGKKGTSFALDKSLIPGGIGAVSPDGGVWMRNGKVVAAFEMKTNLQENAAAATWRWYKNHYILRKMNPNITYVTFAAGPAAKKRKGLRVYGIEWQLAAATLDKNNKPIFNELRPHENTVYQENVGFTKAQLKEKMKEALLKSIA